jgi:hypothetical protein
MDNLPTRPSGALEGGDLSPSDAVEDHSAQTLIVFEGPRNLSQLAEAINAEHSTVQEHLCKGAAAAFKAGEFLLAAKEQVRKAARAEGRRGGWLAWLKHNCKVKERTAQGYERLAKYCHAHPGQAAALLSGSFTKALRSMPVAGKSASVADLEDDAPVAEAMDSTPTPRLAARLASDKEKITHACNCVWNLGMALQRAPQSDWSDEIEPLDRDHLLQFADVIVARLTTLSETLDGGD